MYYFNFILLAIILSFLTIYVYNIFSLKTAGKENLKISSFFILFSLPIALFILIIMSLFLKLANWTLPVNISAYKIFIISFVSVFIIFIGEFIIKIFLSSTISRYLNRKYKNNTLSEHQMLEIISDKHRIIEIFKIILMFLVSSVVYSILFNLLNLVSSISLIIISSLLTSIIYFFMFRSKKII
ncbi:hypothetical protein [Clostridium weizhouense]|uniref:Uncharacterized protein n=1 Tax=Clostridium weizhouense TaxID=2859781 RepID=A0ABS7ARJ9_9CLOT|nr:hypothetical protein [Clostridium weizhouense]MBW6411293.1 hypothetical protein [Clostridium weizhouense]